jgi:hypothetical protein
MWLYNGNPVTSLDQLPDFEDLEGFCYKITNLKTGAIYIGKKNFQSKRKKSLPKKEISTDKRKKTYKIVVKESDWQSYYGSSKQLQEDIARIGKPFFKREILELAKTKKYLSYLELKHQFINNVLGTNSYNGNILGRFYPKDLELPGDHQPLKDLVDQSLN